MTLVIFWSRLEYHTGGVNQLQTSSGEQILLARARGVTMFHHTPQHNHTTHFGGVTPQHHMHRTRGLGLESLGTRLDWGEATPLDLPTLPATTPTCIDGELETAFAT